MFTLHIVDDTGRSHAAITFAEQVLWRAPAAVFGHVLLDKVGHRLDIRIDAPEFLALGVTDRFAVTGADRVDHDQVGPVDDAVFVGHTFERRAGKSGIFGGQQIQNMR